MTYTLKHEGGLSGIWRHRVCIPYTEYSTLYRDIFLFFLASHPRRLVLCGVHLHLTSARHFFDAPGPASDLDMIMGNGACKQ